MKKILSTILVALAFSLNSGLTAGGNEPKPSPESMVICGSGNGTGISGISVPETINVERCELFEDGNCAACLISIEQQGCKIVDVILTHFWREEYGVTVPGTSYLLSCVKP
jgi:hypothetical protein